MKLWGKSREEIAVLTARRSRSELLDLLWRHCALEPMFSPEEIARARGLAPLTVKRLMKAGTIRAHLPGGNRWRAPFSAVAEWDAQTAVHDPVS